VIVDEYEDGDETVIELEVRSPFGQVMALRPRGSRVCAYFGARRDQKLEISAMRWRLSSRQSVESAKAVESKTQHLDGNLKIGNRRSQSKISKWRSGR